jgi:phosphatidate cytidylyltransferase
MLRRWLSALIALVVLFGTYFLYQTPGLVVLCSLIAFVAAVEYSTLFEKTSLWLVAFLVFDAIIFATHMLLPQYSLALLMGCFICLSALGMVLFRHQEPKETLGKIQWTLWGLIYTGLFPSLSVHLLYEKGGLILIYLLITVFLGDTLAFFFGRSFGGPKIFPNISPKKTVSGCIGGLIGSVIFGCLFLVKYSAVPQLWQMILLSLSIGFFAQFGDFFESLIKRVAGKKDSSQLMPGHGGFLDRLDGVYFGSATLYFFCVLLDYSQYF